MGDESTRSAGGRVRPWAAVAAGGFVLAAVVGLRESVTGTPWVIAATALLPPACFAAALLLIGRRERVPWLPALTALLWGIAVAPLVAVFVNDAALRLFPHGLVTTVIGPAIEELSKAGAIVVVLLVWLPALRSVHDGIIYGALAGVGFAAIENLGYYTLAAVQGGAPGLARALYLRGVLEGLNHAAFTAIIGAAIGYARRRRSPRRVGVGLGVAGLGVAIVVHGLWNAIASEAITTVLCNAPEVGAACAPAPRLLDLLVSVPVLVAAFIGPLAATLFALALRERRPA